MSVPPCVHLQTILCSKVQALALNEKRLFVHHHELIVVVVVVVVVVVFLSKVERWEHWWIRICSRNHCKLFTINMV